MPTKTKIKITNKKAVQKKNLKDTPTIKNAANQFLEKYFFDKTRRQPMILPVVIEV